MESRRKRRKKSNSSTTSSSITVSSVSKDTAPSVSTISDDGEISSGSEVECVFTSIQQTNQKLPPKKPKCGKTKHFEIITIPSSSSSSSEDDEMSSRDVKPLIKTFKTENDDTSTTIMPTSPSSSRRSTVSLATVKSEADVFDVDDEEKDSDIETPNESLRQTRRTRTRQATSSVSTLVQKRTNQPQTKKAKRSPRKIIPLDVFALKESRLKTYIKHQRLAKAKSYWLLDPSLLQNQSISMKTFEFFETCGHFLEHIFWKGNSGNASSCTSVVLNSLLQSATNVTKISFMYNTLPDIINLFTKIITPNLRNGNLRNLNSLRLTSVSENGKITRRILEEIEGTGIEWKELELGVDLWEDTVPKPLQRLLKHNKDTLVSFVVQGGFWANAEKPMFSLKLPVMPNLEKLCINRKYLYDDCYDNEERDSDFSEKDETITDNDNEVKLKFAVKFQSEFRKLKMLALGHPGQIDGFSFPLAPNLKTFRCGSSWNLIVSLPSNKFNCVTELQFPDTLQDPELVYSLRTGFPNILKIRINVPSLVVLHAFFAAFESSKVKELILETDYHFKGMLESALFPGFILEPNELNSQEKFISSIKEYKWWSEFLKENKIELPIENVEENSINHTGLLGLKQLRKLRLIHCCRSPIFIPDRDEQRKWSESECRMTTDSVGLRYYPMLFRVFSAICDLKLNEFKWNDMKMNTEKLTGKYTKLKASDFYSSEDDELFDPWTYSLAPIPLLAAVKTEDIKVS